MLLNALIYLLAAVIAVPIAKRLGLGSVLGYLLAGVLIGPYAFALVGDQTDVMHFAEIGVVMMLFLIGLEIRPARLWEMKRSILGLGGLQVLLTCMAIAAALWLLFGLHWQVAVALGLSLSLSSTAIVLQSLGERGLLNTQAGGNAFSVLLLQDIAVIPILAILPLLALGGPAVGAVDAQHGSLIDDLPGWAQFATTIGVTALLVTAGKLLSRPAFRFIAETRSRELFTAFALLIVIATAVGTSAIGLSPALGAFLAGLVLSDNEFRHELEVDIEPFKALLLGLFFITVGAGVNLELLAGEFATVVSLVLLLLALKALVLYGLAAVFRMERVQALLFTVVLAQGGEFAFVLVSAAMQFNVFDSEVGNLVVLVVALSMLISPLLLVGFELILSRYSRARATPEADSDIQPTCQVIIAGFGRFGQIVARLLRAQGIHYTILDHSPSQVDLVRRFGNTVYYGDAARRDLLAAAGANEANALVIAVDEADKTLDIIDTAQKHFPHLKILARAIDRRHAYAIMQRNITAFKRETFDSALNLGVETLKALGIQADGAERSGRLFAQHDEETLLLLSGIWGDDKSYGVAVRQRLDDLRSVLEADRAGIQAPRSDGEKSARANAPAGK